MHANTLKVSRKPNGGQKTAWKSFGQIEVTTFMAFWKIPTKQGTLDLTSARLFIESPALHTKLLDISQVVSFRENISFLTFLG